MSNQIYEVIPFKDFFYYTYLQDVDLEGIKKECYQMQMNDNGRVVSNEGGWQSNDISLTENTHHTSHLISTINIMVNEVRNNINFSPVHLSNAWFNINSPGNSNIRHTHPGCVFSGVFYIDTPNDCGDLEFHRDLRFSDYMWNEFNKNDSKTFVTWRISPEPYKLVIFPSYLVHSVTPNKSNDNRISLSFNYVRPSDSEIKNTQ